MSTRMSLRLLLVASSLLFFPVAFTFAQATCGDIITTEYQYDEVTEENQLVEVRTPIDDCNNPFNVDDPEPFAYKLAIAGQSVVGNSIVSVNENTPAVIEHTTNTTDGLTYVKLFKAEGSDYREITVDFEGETQVITLSNGGYVAVIIFEGNATVGQRDVPGWWGRLPSLLLPSTAQAYFPDFNLVVVVPFKVETIPPAPAGASSILFLPGIMGSRLYEESDVCDDEVKEQERWFSTTDCQQLRLLTDFTGRSVNDIYTKNSQGAIVDEALFQNLYKSFLGELSDWKGEGTIKDFKAVPYDWRLKLEDILSSKVDLDTNQVRYVSGTALKDSYLYQILTDLAEDSLSGKVTVVAHSNGGLVAKALIKELERTNDPLLAKIDNLILVAVPQVGTPESTISILHGSGLGPIETVVSQSTSRRLANTAPFSHHLLPNQSYFDLVDTPVLSFEEGSVSGPWRAQFGSEVTDKIKQHEFLSKDSTRTVPEWDDLLTPAVVDDFLLSYANITEQKFRDWIPPSSISTHQIAGIGLPTVTGITYFTDKECVRRSILKAYSCVEYKDKLGYRINESIHGDQTVVVPSALAMSSAPENVDNWWLNLLDFNDDTFSILGFKHSNIFEIEETAQFVDNIINNIQEVNYEYIVNSPPNFSNDNRLIFTLHSPLDLTLTTSEGKVSSTSDDVAGAVYKRYGEVQYISTPADISSGKTLVLTGEATGSFTLDVEDHKGNELMSRQTFLAIPNSTNTKAVLEMKEGVLIEELEIEVDYDGNGVVDVAYNTQGEVESEPEEITYGTLYSTIDNLGAKTFYKRQLKNMAQIAEQFSLKTKGNLRLFKKKEDVTLLILSQQTTLYSLLHQISKGERDNLHKIINILINKN